MRRLAFFAVCLMPVLAYAAGRDHSDDPLRASRLYKLCLMEDPQCIPDLMAVYRVAKMDAPAWLRADLEKQYRSGSCIRMSQEECVFRRFMEIGRGYLNLSAVDAEMQVLTFGDPCRPC